MDEGARSVRQILSDAIGALDTKQLRKESRQVKEVRVVVWREPEGTPFCPKFRGPTAVPEAMRFLWRYASGADRRAFVTGLIQWLDDVSGDGPDGTGVAAEAPEV